MIALAHCVAYITRAYRRQNLPGTVSVPTQGANRNQSQHVNAEAAAAGTAAAGAAAAAEIEAARAAATGTAEAAGPAAATSGERPATSANLRQLRAAEPFNIRAADIWAVGCGSL